MISTFCVAVGKLRKNANPDTALVLYRWHMPVHNSIPIVSHSQYVS